MASTHPIAITNLVFPTNHQEKHHLLRSSDAELELRPKGPGVAYDPKYLD